MPEETKNFFFLVSFLLYPSNTIVSLLLIADEWQHETDCTVSQDDLINLVHSKTLTQQHKMVKNKYV